MCRVEREASRVVLSDGGGGGAMEGGGGGSVALVSVSNSDSAAMVDVLGVSCWRLLVVSPHSLGQSLSSQQSVHSLFLCVEFRELKKVED